MKIRSGRIALVFMLAALLMAGCATYKHEMGQKIEPLKVDQVIEGKTTEAEAVALLGAPQMVKERPDGSKILIYMHHQTEIYGRPYMRNTKGGTSSNHLYLGIRGGIVRKKWQSMTDLPTKSVMGETLNVPEKYK
jgi:hypothetical protein